MKKIIRNNYKLVLIFISGFIVSVGIVKATTYISGSNVEYSGSLTSDNVQDAIDELYTSYKSKPLITAWEYHETGSSKCINGEEDTCKITTCYKSGSTCTQGTVIKYYVNDNLYHYFYVLRDDGTKITMQQRENTIRNIAWHAGENNNSYGPDTVLPMLEQATSTWTNVNILEYTPGSTTLYENAYTGCSYSVGTEISGYIPTCGTNKYTMSTRRARSRMITVLEAASTGCLVYKDGSKYPGIMGNSTNSNNSGSCPDYMHNYLSISSDPSYGGSYSDDTVNEIGEESIGYWTMSAYGNTSGDAWGVYRHGRLYAYSVYRTDSGARAVVEITKSNL